MRCSSWMIIRSGFAFLLILGLTNTHYEVFGESFEPLAVIELTETCDIDSIGNGSSRCELSLSPEIYQRILRLLTPTYYVKENDQWVAKYKTPKVDHVLRYLGLANDASAIQDVKGDFDNDAATIHVSFRTLGKSRASSGTLGLVPQRVGVQIHDRIIIGRWRSRERRVAKPRKPCTGDLSRQTESADWCDKHSNSRKDKRAGL